MGMVDVFALAPRWQPYFDGDRLDLILDQFGR